MASGYDKPGMLDDNALYYPELYDFTPLINSSEVDLSK